MKWFGESWGAPVCHDVDHAEITVGESCTRCEGKFDLRSQGLIIPCAMPDRVGEVYYHIDCFVASLGGPVGGPL